MKRRCAWGRGAALLLLGAALGWPATARAQTAERELYVTVLNAARVPVAGLTAEYFAVREDGKDRDVLRLQPAGPMHVAVLVDTSLEGTAFAAPLIESLKALVGALAPAQHVALYSIGDRAQQVVPFTGDAVRLRESIEGMFIRTGGGSAVIDGVDVACRDLAAAAAERPVIVAITSETPEVSSRTAGAVVKQLVAGAVTLHAVLLATATGSGMGGTASKPLEKDVVTRRQNLDRMIGLTEGDKERDRLLQQGPAATAGSLQRVTIVTAVRPALDQVLAELGGAYRLTFARPARDKASRDLQVGVLMDDVSVRAIPVPTRK